MNLEKASGIKRRVQSYQHLEFVVQALLFARGFADRGDRRQAV
jgi:hypothetical protein